RTGLAIPRGRVAACAHATEDCMTHPDTPIAPPATDATQAAPATAPAPTCHGAAAAAEDLVPDPPCAVAAAVAGAVHAEGGPSTWITKEAGNRRMPFDPGRLERAIDRVHAEFPQLEITDYK